MPKLIKYNPHALSRMRLRGATKSEVEEAINTSPWRPAKRGKYKAKKEFLFNDYWEGQFYRNKKVEAIFEDRPKEILVFTVITYYY